MAEKPSKESSSSLPSLTPLGEYAGKPPLAIKKEVVVVGTEESSHLHLISSTVSKYHALIIKAEGGVYIHDLASRTKVKVNGKDVQSSPLKNGDKLQIGRFLFQFNGAPGNGEVRPAAPAIVSVDDRQLPGGMEDRALLIGRAEGCGIKLSEPAVSSRHAVIFEANGRRFIRDLNSRTGTFVNGQKTHQAPLKFGDKVRIGQTQIVLTTLKKAADAPLPAPIAPEPLPLVETQPTAGSFAPGEAMQPAEALAAEALASMAPTEPFTEPTPEDVAFNALSTMTAPTDLMSEPEITRPAAPEPSRQAAREALAKAAMTAQTPPPVAPEKPNGLEPIGPDQPTKTPVAPEPVQQNAPIPRPAAKAPTPAPARPIAPQAAQREMPIGLEPIGPDEQMPAPTFNAPTAPATSAGARVRPAVPPPLGTRAPEPVASEPISEPIQEEPADLGLEFVEDIPGAKPAAPAEEPLPLEPVASEPVSEVVVPAEQVPQVSALPDLDAGLELPSLDIATSEPFSIDDIPELQPSGAGEATASHVATATHAAAEPVELAPASAIAAQPVRATIPSAATTPTTPNITLVQPTSPALPTMQVTSFQNFDWAVDKTRSKVPVEPIGSEPVEIEPAQIETAPIHAAPVKTASQAEPAVTSDWTQPEQDLIEAPRRVNASSNAESSVSPKVEAPAPPPAEFDLPPATPAIESPIFDLGHSFESESSSTLLPELNLNFATIHPTDAEPEALPADAMDSIAQQGEEIEIVPPAEEATQERTENTESATASEPLELAAAFEPAEPISLEPFADVAGSAETSAAEPIALEPEPQPDPQNTPEPAPILEPQDLPSPERFVPAQDLVPLEPEGIATANAGAVALPEAASIELPEASATADTEAPAKRRRGRPKKAEAPPKPVRGKTKRQPPGVVSVDIDTAAAALAAAGGEAVVESLATTSEPQEGAPASGSVPPSRAGIPTVATIPAEASPAEPAIDLALPETSFDAVAPPESLEQPSAPLEQETTPLEFVPPVPQTDAPIEIDQSALTSYIEQPAAPDEPPFEEAVPRVQASVVSAEQPDFAIDLTVPDLPAPIVSPHTPVEGDAGIFKSGPAIPAKGLAALQVREEDFARLDKGPGVLPEAASMPADQPEAAPQTLHLDDLKVEPIGESLEPFSESKVDLDAYLTELEKQVEPAGSAAEITTPTEPVVAEISARSPAETSPSDSAFGREIESFTSDSTGPLVEDLKAAADVDLEMPALDLPEVEPIPSIHAEEPVQPSAQSAAPMEGPLPVEETPHAEDALSVEEISPEEETPVGTTSPLPDVPQGLSNSSFNLASTGFAFDTESSIDRVLPPQQQLATADSSSITSEPFPPEPPPTALSEAETGAQSPQTPQGPPAAPAAPLNSPEGLSHIGGGIVNLDHFLGGMPIRLPDLPPPPAHFGRIAYDLDGRSAPKASPPPSAKFQSPFATSPLAESPFTPSTFEAAPTAQPEARVYPPPQPPVAPPSGAPARIAPPAAAPPLVAPPAAPPRPAPASRTPSTAAPAPAAPPRVAPPAAPAARPAAAPPAAAPAAPATPAANTPAAPAPVAKTPVARPAAAPPSVPPIKIAAPQSPPAPAKLKTPPRPRTLGPGPASGKAASGGADDAFAGITTAFEGLSAAVRQTDVFSNLETNVDALGNAVFGAGVRGKEQPATSTGPSDLPRDPDKDFADDDFWNRTDEEDGLPPMGVPKEPEPVAVPPANEIPAAEAQAEQAATEALAEEPPAAEPATYDALIPEQPPLEDHVHDELAGDDLPLEDRVVHATAHQDISLEAPPEEPPTQEVLPQDTPAEEMPPREIPSQETPFQETPSQETPADEDFALDNLLNEDFVHDETAHQESLDQLPPEELATVEPPPVEPPHAEFEPPQTEQGYDEPPAPPPTEDAQQAEPTPDPFTAHPLAEDPVEASVTRDEASVLEAAFGQPATQADDSEIARINRPTAEPAVAAAPRRGRRSKTRTRVLIGAMLGSMALALGAIWTLVPVRSNITGTVTFENYDYTPDSSDGIQFESSQRKLLADPQMRLRAIDIMRVQHPNLSDGFLDVPDLYTRATSSFTLSSSHTGDHPETAVAMTYDSNRASQDKPAMAALLQAFIVADSGTVDTNRRLRADAQAAAQAVTDARQKLDHIVAQISELEARVANQPSVDSLTDLTSRKAQLEAQLRAAENAADSDRQLLSRLQSPSTTDDQGGAPAANADGSAPPDDADPQLRQMKQELADLNANLAAAKADEQAGATLARQQLEGAVKDFNDQLSDADTVLGSSTELKQFVDSAKDSQVKARSLITMLIVDGEDLEKQLEDTRQDVENLIQERQRQKWAADPQLQQLQASLDSAQHKYNAAVGQGIQDASILNPLQHEIDDWTGQIKARQAQLGIDPSEVKVETGLDQVIAANRSKLDKEKVQIDQVLDPLEKQLSDLDPVVAALPDAQQELARKIRERLNALNDARKHYADAVGEGTTAPSAKVTSLQQQLSALKTQFDRRQADLAILVNKRLEVQRGQDLITTKQKLDSDTENLTAIQKAYFDVQLKLEDVSAKRDAAKADQIRLLGLADEKTDAAKAVDDAQRDYDQKQAASASAYDIKPFSDGDVTSEQSGDPRWNYSAFAVIGLAVIFAMMTVISNPRAHETLPPAPLHDGSDELNPRNRAKDPTAGNGFQTSDNGEEAKWA
jgi:pSer/pThr/pTyr-binding forkhead associated (FHA) protein